MDDIIWNILYILKVGYGNFTAVFICDVCCKGDVISCTWANCYALYCKYNTFIKNIMIEWAYIGFNSQNMLYYISLGYCLSYVIFKKINNLMKSFRENAFVIILIELDMKF